jgi:glycine oxidase
MAAPLRIVGQGLAGTLLAWSLEQAGREFVLFDRFDAQSSSRVGAGIINPVTGQRVVKSWRVDEWLPLAIRMYQGIGEALGCVFAKPVRIRRFFRNEREKTAAVQKLARGELDPYVTEFDALGFWVHHAWRVDTAALVDACRARWLSSGLLKEGIPDDESAPTVWCLGPAEAKQPRFAYTNMAPAKGEILTVEAPELAPDCILNKGHWVLPIGDGLARVGATFEPGKSDRTPTPAARAELQTAAEAMLGRSCGIISHDAGVRLTTPDKHPVVGWHRREPLHGIFNGLGSKGALLAPALAKMWADHLVNGAPFDGSVDVARFVV